MSTTELSVHFHLATELAIFVSDDGDRRNAVWLPKSKVQSEAVLDVENYNKTIEIEVPIWLAVDKGLV